MPILNRDKCFAQQPVRLTVQLPAQLPGGWLDSLYQLAAKQLELDDQHRDEEGHTQTFYFIKDAKKHTGEFSTYTHKAKLINSLKILYAAFISPKVTDNQKTMMAYKLQEGAQNCSPGFHDRVEFVILLLNLLENLDQLLAKTRVSIVEQIAAIALQNDTQSVHGQNRFFVTAQAMGYGVRPINPADIYINEGGVEHQQMVKALTDGFASFYGLFGMLTSLRDQLEAILREQGYSGRKEMGASYSNEECERFSGLIKPFIKMNDDALWETDINEEFSVKTVFGIHWQNVKRALLQKLRDEKYIDLSRKESRVLTHLPAITNDKALTLLIPNAHEFAQCLVFFSEWTIEQKTAFTNAYLNDKSVTEQEAVLSVLESQAASLTKQLKSQPAFQSRYFKIAIQKNKISDVKAYIEQGADINAALSLLFSEAHKSDSLYWLYEHKNLIATITPDGMKAVIPDGKYKDKTMTEALASTKKGRQVLLENASLHALLSDTVLNHARSEKQSIVMPDGFFKKPDALATQLGQYVAYSDLVKAEKILLDNPGLIKKLLTEKVTVTDYSGCKKKHKTAFQIALCAWDVKLNVSDDETTNDPDAMCEMLTKYMIKEDIHDVYRQYNEIFPNGHQEFFENQKPFDFSEIIQAITTSSKEDVQTALDLIQPNNTPLWRALEKFRAQFTELSKKEMVWNPKHLIEAFEQYDKQYNGWNANNGIQQDLFWRQVVGFTQRFLPANIAMDFAQGLYDRVDEKKKPLRTFNFTYGGGAIYPIRFRTLAGLGYEFGGAAVGMRTGGGGADWVGEWLQAGSGRVGPYKTYVEQKQQHWKTCAARADSGTYKRVSDRLDR